MRDYFHAERSSEVSNCLSNPTITNNAEHQAIQLDQWFVPITPIETADPAAFTNRLRVVSGILGQLQEQRHGHLRNRACSVGRHICYGDLSFPRSSQIDDVRSSRSDSNVFQLWKRFDHLAC